MVSMRSNRPIYPLLGLFISVTTLVVGLISVRNPHIIYLYGGLILVYLLLGYYKNLLMLVPALVIMSSIFGGLTYLAANDIDATKRALLRGFAVCFSVLPALSISTTSFIRNLKQVNAPKAITLGMLIALNFIPILRKEMQQVRDAMRTRGVFGASFKVLYRAFLIPLMIRIIHISDTLSLSVETRGFTLDKTKTTVYEPIAFGRRDFLLLITVVTLVVGVMVL